VNTLKNTSLKVSISTQIKPKIEGINLSFDILTLQVNSLIKQKKLNKYVREKLEKVNIPIRRLKKIAWIVKVKKLHFDAEGNLELGVKFSVFMILLAIAFLLLREIALLFIIIYQKFFSSLKNYRCAKGELYKKGTCSSTSKEAFKKHGFIAGMREYYKSKKACKKAYHSISKKRPERHQWANGVECGGCDILGLSSVHGCDVGSC
jgi:putative component of membrane protein insertase Oxa1/YidC/SpoIIIJ protein YidD